ncbi:uncharacterized beta-barrel protein YwiB (DUF1934 family) [Peribacillus deserti]|uniref:Uncharacterized beta-barrel protein YwiB (DUF1934 family) n=1 Tax=Peribacillus deserti TaxID=673318 RepID=A0ABS2QC25_9BACI|nr:DUF1934 domain-containing protein [Peribacillus deserti]MBM7690642.1 uncharacterized beta-barrel protein YwiB (DUF1934 family) [Peribacillus deserti]
MLQTDSDKRSVRVTVKTTITNGSETETFELATLGNLHNKANADYLQYEEKDENGLINTYVKFTDTELMLMRSGSVTMKQYFRENEVTSGYYESMYGRLEMQTDTSKIVREWNDPAKEGKIELYYDLMMQGNHLGVYQMTIIYKEEA